MLCRGTSYDLGAVCAGEQLTRSTNRRQTIGRPRSKEVGRPRPDDPDAESSASDAEQNAEDLHLARSMPELITAYTLASDSPASGLTLGLPRRYVTAGGQSLFRKYALSLAVKASCIWAVTELQASAKPICCIIWLLESSRCVQKYPMGSRSAFKLSISLRFGCVVDCLFHYQVFGKWLPRTLRYLTHSCLTHVYLVYVAAHELWLQEARRQAAEDGQLRDTGLARDA